jgi:hypothetical protein
MSAVNNMDPKMESTQGNQPFWSSRMQ